MKVGLDQAAHCPDAAIVTRLHESPDHTNGLSSYRTRAHPPETNVTLRNQPTYLNPRNRLMVVSHDR
jgi:hypothetical protein